MKFLDAQKAAGINPYPHKFHVTLSIAGYIEKYGGLNNGDHLEDVQVSLAGRRGWNFLFNYFGVR